MQVTINIRPELKAVCEILQVSPVDVTQLLLEKQLEENDNTLYHVLLDLSPLNYKSLDFDIRMILDQLRLLMRDLYALDHITVDELHERTKIEIQHFTYRWKTVINHNLQNHE